ncbi:hypothetical protein [Corynebacterium kalidii]
MTVAVVALVLGFALLVFAAGLFWRASNQSQARRPRPRTAGPSAPSGPSAPELTSRWEDAAETAAPVDGESVQDPLPDAAPDAVAVSAAVSAEDAAPETAQAGEPIPESRGTTGAAGSADTAQAEVAESAETPETYSSGLFAGRRTRRQWAHSHGYEYAKEDRYLPGEWPDSLMALVRDDASAGSTTVARDLVSGFTGGHQFHLAEVNGITVVALRREVFSPVQVHLSDGAAMPAGMRHSELCDRPPYTGYSSDNRALDRMLDSRVDAALHALAGSVSDIAFSTTWVTMRMSRRTDPPIWDHVIFQGRALVAASRVLPPRVTSQELDMTNADPTRPRVRGTVDAAVGGHDGHDGHDGSPQDPDEGATQRGHLRAVPDAVAPDAAPADADDVPADDVATASAGESRPRMERSATPVDFPTRSEAQTMGDVSDFPEHDRIDGDGGDGEAGGVDAIPAVGEDPEHSRRISGGGPRVIRASGQRSTIFGDETDTDTETATDADTDAVRTTSAEVDIIGTVPGQGARGRHRAPSARHARRAGDPGEGHDYPEVDAEVVDPEDN